MNLRLKRNRESGFLLIEILITVIILGTAIVFIVQALSSSLFAARRAQFYTKALMLMDELYWDIKLEQYREKLLSTDNFPRSSDFSQEPQFKAREELLQTELPNISEIVFTVFWQDAKAGGELCASTFIPTATLGEE